MAQNKQYKASITIGGAVSGAFKGALKETDSQISQLGSTIKALEQRQQRFGTVAGNLKTIGRDASMVSDRYREMGVQLEKMRATQERLVSLNRASQANIARREELRGQLVDAVGLAASVVGPIREAMAEEMSQFRLGTVVANNADVGLGKTQARKIAASGLANLQEAYDSQYALFSAGFDGIAARAGSQVAIGVAKITGGAVEGVTEVIATAYNNLGQQLDGSTEEKLQRIGDILTKTQFKFQIRDFNQLGESFKMASSTLSGLNINVEQGATVLGLLNTAGLQGSMAGTAFSAMMRNMNKAAEEYGFTIQRTADGQMDLIGTLEQLNEAIGDMDIDERQAEIQRLFGDEGARAIVPLINQMGELRGMVKDVAENSAGLVQANVDKYLATSTAQAGAFWQQLKIVGSTIGTVLLPPLNQMFQIIGPILGAVADLAQEFPMLTSAIVIGTTALIGFKVAAIAGGYAMTFVKGGVLSMATVFTRMQAGLQIATAGMRALNLAMLMNPVGLVIGGIVAAGALLYKFWEPISAFFGGFWDGFMEGMQPIMPMFNVLASAFQPVIDVVSSLWDWFSNLLEPVQLTSEGFAQATSAGQIFGKVVGMAISTLLNPIGSMMDALGWIGSKLGLFDDEGQPPSATIGAAAQSAANATVGKAIQADADQLPENMQAGADVTSSTVNNQRSSASQQNTFQIQIVQQPGEDSEAFAQRTADIIEERKRQQEMAALYDGAQ